jgi:hypothetical protein
MHEPINVKSPNNTSKWQMGFNSAFPSSYIRYRRFSDVGRRLFLVPPLLKFSVSILWLYVIAVQPALSGNLRTIALSLSAVNISTGQCHLISSEFQTSYRREVIAILLCVNCWVSSFQQVFLSVVSKNCSLEYWQRLKLSWWVSGSRQTRAECHYSQDVVWRALTYWHTFDVWEMSLPVKTNVSVLISAA